MFDWLDKNSSGGMAGNRSENSGDGLKITDQIGLLTGTHVVSNLGWRTVETLNVGDKVLTFDHGMQLIVEIRRDFLTGAPSSPSDTHYPIFVPTGALHNRADFWLMPDQGVLVESEAAIDALGDPFAVIPARALTGLKQVCQALPNERMEVTTLTFASDEVIYVEGGMLAHCPRPRQILSDDLLSEPLYDVLDLQAAQFLVECLVKEKNVSALACDAEEIAVLTSQRAQITRPLQF